MNKTIESTLAFAKHQLAVVADNPVLEAEVLLSHVLKKPRTYLHAWSEKSLSENELIQYADCLARRREREPIAYITGSREFWSLDLLVTKDTLIPRPETEMLVEEVLTLFGEREKLQVADLGTGSGAIAIALAHERPAWQVIATDASESALQVASKNAQRLGINNISFCQGNWCTALPVTGLDVIVSNPPYLGECEWAAYAEGLAYEPRSALVSNVDGLDCIRTIICHAKKYLKPNGYVILEHGYLQGAAVRKLFAASGYSQIHSIRDLALQERVTMGQYHP